MRFAGSAVDFSQPTYTPSTAKSSSASAANVVNVNDTFGAMRQKAPKYDSLSAAAMQTEAKKEIASWDAQSQVAAQGLSSMGNVIGQGVSAYGKLQGDKKIAEAQKSAAQSNMLGSIAGAALGMFSF